MSETYIISAKRTPIGSFMGSLSTVPAPRLGAEVIQSLLKTENAIPAEDVQECIMGQVLTAGGGQAPARQSALYAGLNSSTQCMSINKVCGSGLKALLLAHMSIALKQSDLIIAGGQENMSLAPYILPKARVGFRLGSSLAEDTLIKDGLWDPHQNLHMGSLAELCAKEYKISRQAQDEFAIQSYKKAHKAQKEGSFALEIRSVSVSFKKGNILVSEDEEPGKVLFDKIPHLKPAFEKEGGITPANASKINDGAAGCLLASKLYLTDHNLKPQARIIAQGSFAKDPEHFTTAPIRAVQNCLKNAGLTVKDIDLFEINEAFSVVALVVAKELSIPMEKLNVHGGAVALGHPIGSSGARILVTLLHALKKYNKRYGIAGICLGGGEAVSILIENSWYK